MHPSTPGCPWHFKHLKLKPLPLHHLSPVTLRHTHTLDPLALFDPSPAVGPDCHSPVSLALLNRPSLKLRLC